MSKDREELSQKVILLAANLLEKEGHEALTVRRIAQESGASTQLIYTLFGGKFGLIDELYREGFRRMVEFMHARQDASDPKKNLENLLRGYREWAFSNKAFFTVMCTRPVAEYNPPPESLQKAWQSFQVLIDAVDKCQQVGLLKGDKIYIARKLWSQIHGIVSLELIGHLWDKAGDKILDEMIQNLWV